MQKNASKVDKISYIFPFSSTVQSWLVILTQSWAQDEYRQFQKYSMLKNMFLFLGKVFFSTVKITNVIFTKYYQKNTILELQKQWESTKMPTRTNFKGIYWLAIANMRQKGVLKGTRGTFFILLALTPLSCYTGRGFFLPAPLNFKTLLLSSVLYLYFPKGPSFSLFLSLLPFGKVHHRRLTGVTSKTFLCFKVQKILWN